MERETSLQLYSSCVAFVLSVYCGCNVVCAVLCVVLVLFRIAVCCFIALCCFELFVLLLKVSCYLVI